ncbi:MAG: hypothetical protein WAX77_05960 [Methylococcaceae bacterium]
MLKSYEAIYENGTLNWLGVKPSFEKARVIVVVEEHENMNHSIKQLKGLVPKPHKTISLEDMDNAIELEGAKL